MSSTKNHCVLVTTPKGGTFLTVRLCHSYWFQSCIAYTSKGCLLQALMLSTPYSVVPELISIIAAAGLIRYYHSLA
jgi:hypothetical protein